MSGLISAMPEGNVKTVPAGNYVFTYTHAAGYIYVLCSDSDDNKEELEKKIRELMMTMVEKYAVMLETITKEQKDEMEDKIDNLVYINLPLEISFTRVLLRSIEKSTDEDINAFYKSIGPQFNPKFSEKPTKLMHIMYWQLRMYLQEHREIYLKDHQIHLENADLIIDGMKTSEELVAEILIEFQKFVEKNEQK